MVGIDVLTILEVAPLVTLLVAYLKIEFVPLGMRVSF